MSAPADLPAELEAPAKKKKGSPAFFIRLKPSEKRALTAAAKARGMKLGTFLKAAAHAVVKGSIGELRIRPSPKQISIKAVDQVQLDMFPESGGSDAK